jgi:O-antigen ligase
MTLAYPYRFTIPVGPFNSFSIAEIVLGLAWVILVPRQLLAGLPHQKQPNLLHGRLRLSALDGAIFSYVGMNLLSFLWAERLDFAIRGMIPIVENLAFYYFIILYVTDRDKLNRIVQLYLGLGVAALALSALFYFWRLEFLEIVPAQEEMLLISEQTRLGSPAWGQSNYFASFMLLFLPIYLSLAILAKSKWRRLVFRAIVAGGVVMFFFTLSRGGYASLAWGLAVWLFLMLKRRKFSSRAVTTMFVTGVAIALGLGAAFLYFPDIHLPIADLSGRVLTIDDFNVRVRLHLFQTAWDNIQNSFMGVGLGNFAAVDELGGMSVHSIYLQTLLEIGWLGGAIFMLMLYLLLRQNQRLIKTLERTPYEPLAFGLVTGFLAILVNVAVEASFEGIVFGWIFWMTQGMVRALGSQFWSRNES